jgi:DNA-directed RNA polymerase specialized sigma subunit
MNRKGTAMKNTQKSKNDNAQSEELTHLKDIKALPVLLLLKAGATQNEVAKALNTTQATVSRQFRFGQLKSIATTILTLGRRVES